MAPVCDQKEVISSYENICTPLKINIQCANPDSLETSCYVNSLIAMMKLF